MLRIFTCVPYKNKKKIPHRRNISKIQNKIVARGQIDTINTQIHDRPLSCLGTDTSKKKVAGLN